MNISRKECTLCYAILRISIIKKIYLLFSIVSLNVCRSQLSTKRMLISLWKIFNISGILRRRIWERKMQNKTLFCFRPSVMCVCVLDFYCFSFFQRLKMKNEVKTLKIEHLTLHTIWICCLFPYFKRKERENHYNLAILCFRHSKSIYFQNIIQNCWHIVVIKRENDL